MKLSKREIVMLTFLIILGMIFVEYRFVIMPSITQYDELTLKADEVQAQVDTIKLTIATAKNLEKKRDENLVKIKELSVPYIDGVNPDSLLAYTHELVLKHELVLESYSPSAVIVNQMTPEQAIAFNLTYDLKSLAEKYQQIGQATPTPTPTPSENADSGQNTGNENAPKDFVEQYNIIIMAKGTYAQIYSFIQEIQSLNRSIIISNINIQPTTDSVTVPDAASPDVTAPDVIVPGQDTILGVELWLNFYGITKLIPADEPINDWSRPAVTGKTDNPFYYPTPTPTPQVTPTPGP